MRRSRTRKLKVELNQPQEEPKELLKNFLLTPAIILGILTALLYFHGQALYSGYLSYWGLSSQLFSLSFEETLIHGGWSYITLIFDKWLYFAWFVGYFLIIYILVFLLLNKKPASIIFRLTNTKRINKGQKLVLSKVWDRILQLCVLIFIILAIVIVMSWCHQKGQLIAQTEHNKFRSDSFDSSKKVEFQYIDGQESEQTVSGALIQSTASMIALYTEDDYVLTVPVSRMILVRQKLTKTLQGINSE